MAGRVCAGPRRGGPAAVLRFEAPDERARRVAPHEHGILHRLLPCRGRALNVRQQSLCSDVLHGHRGFLKLRSLLQLIGQLLQALLELKV